MSHNQSLSTLNPGLIAITLDTSDSMSASFGGKLGGIKCAECAKAVNRVLRELGIRCTATDDEGNSYVRNRCEVCIVGYGSTVTNAFGGNLKSKKFVTMEELIENCLEIETVKVKVSDGAGSLIEVDDEFPIWIKPVASGGTPMGEAFEQAYDLISEWVVQHPESFPPIVINITDGEPNDMALAKRNALKLMNVGTKDGGTLIFNIHISSGRAAQVILPSDVSQLPNGDANAQFLFEISSTLPEIMLAQAKSEGYDVKYGARGFAYNADAETMISILNIGSKDRGQVE